MGRGLRVADPQAQRPTNYLVYLIIPDASAHCFELLLFTSTLWLRTACCYILILGVVRPFTIGDTLR